MMKHTPSEAKCASHLGVERHHYAAFTFVEMILVITMIALLASMFVIDFRQAQREQEVISLATQTVAMMQQARAEVSAGRTGEAGWLCEGAYFEVGSLPLFASADFDSQELACGEVITEAYGFSTGGAFVKEISVGLTPVNDLNVMFVPPEAAVYYIDSAGMIHEGDLIVTVGREGDEERQISLDTDLGVLSLIPAPENEE
jgi:type II secretory pathway pseudopilin PulG